MPNADQSDVFVIYAEFGKVQRVIIKSSSD